MRKGRGTVMGWGIVPRFVTSRSTLEKGTDMKIQLKTLAATAALIAGIISAPAAHADGKSKSPGSMMGQGGMMQGGQMSPGMTQGGQMGQGGMMGMMNMMGQMSQMMATCNQMMQAMMKNHDSSMPGDRLPDGAPGKKKEG